MRCMHCNHGLEKVSNALSMCGRRPRVCGSGAAAAGALGQHAAAAGARGQHAAAAERQGLPQQHQLRQQPQAAAPSVENLRVLMDA